MMNQAQIGLEFETFETIGELPRHVTLTAATDSVEPLVTLLEKDPATPRREMINGGDHVIVDLDGTLIRGGRPTDGAKVFLESVAGRYIVVSNNSTETANRLSAKLARMGLSIPPERLILAGEETIRFAAARYPGARCVLATSGLLRDMAAREGLEPVDQHAEFVILGRDLRWNYRQLTLLLNELRRGAVLIVTNPDLTHPDREDRIIPETGSLLAALVAGSGVTPAHIVGKPEALLFEEALRRLGSEPGNTIVVGDNPSTDREGAQRLGLRCVLVSADRTNFLPCITDLIDPGNRARSSKGP
jgi:HAD superfamily hydrolase (TIGR01450 family)